MSRKTKNPKLVSNPQNPPKLPTLVTWWRKDKVDSIHELLPHDLEASVSLMLVTFQ
jgi:hypothetical protein